MPELVFGDRIETKRPIPGTCISGHLVGQPVDEMELVRAPVVQVSEHPDNGGHRRHVVCPEAACDAHVGTPASDLQVAHERVREVPREANALVDSATSLEWKPELGQGRN